jgi:hypothetical protein
MALVAFHPGMTPKKRESRHFMAECARTDFVPAFGGVTGFAGSSHASAMSVCVAIRAGPVPGAGVLQVFRVFLRSGVSPGCMAFSAGCGPMPAGQGESSAVVVESAGRFPLRIMMTIAAGSFELSFVGILVAGNAVRFQSEEGT